MTRRFILLALAAGLLSVPAQASAAGWGSPVTLPGSEAKVTDRSGMLRFDAAGNGLAEWVKSTASISRTTDGAASWTTGMSPAYVPDLIAVGLDGAGNRVYAYPASYNVRIARTGPTGVPDATNFKDVPANARSVSLAVNPAGDVLIAWTSDNTSDETGIAFWAHDKAQPNAPQLLPKLAGKSNATPFAVLDPDRHAVVAYQQDGQLLQTESPDAGATAFNPPSTLSVGEVGGMTGGQAPDGRAAIAWYETRTITPNQYASNKRFDLHASVRGIGKAFGAPQLVDGSDDIMAGYYGHREVAISPTGKAIIGYMTQINRGVSLPCDMTIGDQKTAVATAQITRTGEGGFASQVLAGGGNVNGLAARVAAGPDGRLAASWQALVGCGNANVTSVAGAAFGAKDQPLSPTIPGPPRFVGALGFLADGRFVALSSASCCTAGPLATLTYDSGVPVAPVDEAPPVTDPPVNPPPAVLPGPSGLVPSGGTSSTTVFSAGLASVKPRNDGTVRVTVNAPTAGQVLLEALVKKSRIGSVKAKVKKAGAVTLTLRPTGKAKRTLRRTGRLAITLRMTFTPTGRKAAKPLTRKATLRYKVS
jgi:hypothetical protein